MGFARDTTAGSTIVFVVRPRSTAWATTTAVADLQRELGRITASAARTPNALPRASQLEVLADQAAAARRVVSPLERARFGWHDAPRRPCYRAPRAR